MKRRDGKALEQASLSFPALPHNVPDKVPMSSMVEDGFNLLSRLETKVSVTIPAIIYFESKREVLWYLINNRHYIVQRIISKIFLLDGERHHSCGILLLPFGNFPWSWWICCLSYWTQKKNNSTLTSKPLTTKSRKGPELIFNPNAALFFLRNYFTWILKRVICMILLQ